MAALRLTESALNESVRGMLTLMSSAHGDVSTKAGASSMSCTIRFENVPVNEQKR